MLAQLTRTAVYGPVRTVVWQGSAGDRGPYADQIPLSHIQEIVGLSQSQFVKTSYGPDENRHRQEHRHICLS